MKVWLLIGALIALTYAGDASIYGDQSAWGGECGTSERQSPIDINHIHRTIYYGSKVGSFGGNVEITRITDKKMQFDITDSENTIIKMPENWPVGHTNGLQAKQIHFHWGPIDGDGGSEHTLFGKRYAGEAHLVTRNLDQEDDSAGDAYAVFGIFLEHGDPEDDAVTANLQDLVSGAATELSLDILYSPERTKSIFTYDGGLTTPDCQGIVFWQVLEHTVKVPKELINDMRGATKIVQNYRDLQELNGRHITHRLLDQHYTSPEGGSETCHLDCRSAQETCMWKMSGSTATIPSLFLLFIGLIFLM